MVSIEIKDLRGNPKPRVSPDRAETGPGSGNIFKNIFVSGRGILFRVGPGRGIFYRGMRHFLAFHSQTVEEEWLLSLISTLCDVITSLQGDVFIVV